jgi:hypothetical protein
MLVHRSRFDHGFNPQNAVEAALSRVAKSPPVHARQTHIDALPAPCVLKSTQATGNPWPVDAARARTHLDRSA